MDLVKLSKDISYALRHAPQKYGLELDSEGNVPAEKLLEALNGRGRYERTVTAEDIERVIETSDKKRFEIKDGLIRALYGHSVAERISKDDIEPPDILYHGTAHKALGAIMDEGLKPMGRQYVHLSADTDTAVQVGRRRDKMPVILKISARKAYNNGIRFYRGNEKVILCDLVPPQYIEIDS